MTLTADFNPNVAVPFSRMRYLLQESGGGLQAGVVGATDLKVVQRGAGANMSVDVGAGGAWVAVTGTRNGLAHCFNDATANVTITAAHATLPRLDQILLRYNDSSIPTGSGDIPTLEVSTGTATSGATLDNRTGAATPTGSFLRLADVIVAAADTSITTSEIRDRRPWARGAYYRYARTSADYSTSSTTAVAVDATNLAPLIECTGNPLTLSMHGTLTNNGVANNVTFSIYTYPAGVATLLAGSERHRTVGASFGVGLPSWSLVLPAGSQKIEVRWRVDAQVGAIQADTVLGFEFEAAEIVRPNASNT